MKSLKIITLLLFCALFTVNCAKESKYKKTAATEYCEKQGGIVKTAVITKDNEKLDWIYCEFEDKSICPVWAYINNGCQKNKCYLECRHKGTDQEGIYSSCSDLKVDDKCTE